MARDPLIGLYYAWRTLAGHHRAGFITDTDGNVLYVRCPDDNTIRTVECSSKELDELRARVTQPEKEAPDGIQ